MTVTESVRRPPVAVRRVGYVVAAAFNAAMLYVVNVWPGWPALSFLTDDTPRVLGWVNLTLAAGVVVNIVLVGYDPRWLKALGDLVTTVVGLISTVRILQVFPFDFTGYELDWASMLRIALIVAIAASALGILIQLFTLIRRLGELS